MFTPFLDTCRVFGRVGQNARVRLAGVRTSNGDMNIIINAAYTLLCYRWGGKKDKLFIIIIILTTVKYEAPNYHIEQCIRPQLITRPFKTVENLWFQRSLKACSLMVPVDVLHGLWWDSIYLSSMQISVKYAYCLKQSGNKSTLKNVLAQAWAPSFGLHFETVLLSASS